MENTDNKQPGRNFGCSATSETGLLKQPAPTLGRIVHYCWSDNNPTNNPMLTQGSVQRAAAMVTKHHGKDIADLHIFFNVENDGMLGVDRFKVSSTPTEKPNGITAWWEWPPRV